MNLRSVLCAVFVMFFGFLSGCGYTQKTVLPNDIKTIYVKTIENHIPVEEIIAYQAGLEMDITNAIIRRLHKDGNLKVVEEDEADVVLAAKLTHFDQEGVRFSRLETVQEFRVFIVLSMQLTDTRTGNAIWVEPNFSGDTEFFVSNIRSIAREEATRDAVSRLARNVVDRIVEDW